MPNIIPKDTRELTIGELDGVSAGIKGAVEGVCRKDEGARGGQNDPAQMFQQILRSLTQQ